MTRVTKKKKLERAERQKELLKHFTEDHYEEKEIEQEWFVKMWNGDKKIWQVAVFSKESFARYKQFQKSKAEAQELDLQFKESLL